LLLRRKEGDGLVAVGGVGSGQTEVELVARAAQGRAAYSKLGCAILVFGERLRVDHVQLQLAPGARGQLLEDLTNAEPERCDLRYLRGTLGRVEEVEVDRLLDALEDPVGSRSGRVQMILREIEPPPAQGVIEQHGQAYEQQRQRQKRPATQC